MVEVVVCSSVQGNGKAVARSISGAATVCPRAGPVATVWAHPDEKPSSVRPAATNSPPPDPELAIVNRRWAGVPVQIRTAILALVKADY